MTFSIDNPGGVATLRKICLGKTLRRTRVNSPFYNSQYAINSANVALADSPRLFEPMFIALITK